MSILVLGSFVMDCVTKTDIVPNEGETVLGKTYQTFLGGKGINQAVAAARLGETVYMAGMLGDDSYAKQFITMMNEEHINHDHVYQSQQTTGIGNIILNNKTALNQIIVIPGANHDFSTKHLNQLTSILKQVDYVVAQLELKLDVMIELADLCHKHHKKLILNPAPAQKLPIEFLQKIDVLTPNEHELKLLTGYETKTIEQVEIAAHSLIKQGVKKVITTMGKNGALWVEEHQTYYHKGYSVKAVDTVAAGDSFNGALVYGLNQQFKPEYILKFANATGALSVTREGAIPSLPHIDDVKRFLKEHDQ